MVRFGLVLVAALALFCASAKAQVYGVDVQVNENKPIPTADQLAMILPPGGFVRDVLGWQRVDRTCDLRSNPLRQIAIPAASATLYAAVQASGARNFVTLAFSNKFCGQPTGSGAKYFPNTPALRAEFAAYAVAVVRQVPALGGVSIWNEFNGTWNGGYKSNRAQALTDYCLLSNAVIAEIRKANPNLPVAIGATIGADVGSWFVDMFDTYGCKGKGDPTIWLDVHPYLSGRFLRAEGKVDWTVWNDSVDTIRADGITNPFVATEWGARAAYLWTTAHPNSDYMTNFKNRVVAADPHWAGLMWYEMLYDHKSPNAGLFDQNGELNSRGTAFVDAFR